MPTTPISLKVFPGIPLPHSPEESDSHMLPGTNTPLPLPEQPYLGPRGHCGLEPLLLLPPFPTTSLSVLPILARPRSVRSPSEFLSLSCVPGQSQNLLTFWKTPIVCGERFSIGHTPNARAGRSTQALTCGGFSGRGDFHPTLATLPLCS